MKIIFKLIALSIFLIVAVTNMHAQRGSWNADPEERAKQQTDRMTEILALSEKQSEKVGEINLKYARQMADARSEAGDADRSAMRESFMQLRAAQNEELKSVMTTEQFETWIKYQEERRERRGNRGGKDKKTEDKQG